MSICIFLFLHVCTISKDIGTNEEKQICLPNKDSESVHISERKTIAAKYEMFMNCSKNFTVILHKTNMTAKHRILRSQRCEGKNMVYKHIWGCQLNTAWALVFYTIYIYIYIYIYITVCTIYWHK